MSIGNNMIWWIVGLFVLVAVIILGIVFSPDFHVQPVPLNASPIMHDKIARVNNTMAKSSLNDGKLKSQQIWVPGKNSEGVNEYGHLSSSSQMFGTDPPYAIRDVRNILQQINSSGPLDKGGFRRLPLRRKKLLNYNYDPTDAIAAADSDKSGSLGSNSNFDSPYSQNRTPFVKSHGHIQDEKWANEAVLIAHSGVDAAPSVIVEGKKPDN